MVRLGDVCTKGTSNIAQKDLEGHDGSYPIFGASGFIKYVDFYQQENPYIAIVKDGAGIGRVMKLPAKSSVIGTMQYIHPGNMVDISYLAYAMEHMNLSKYFTGATIPHIYFKDYQKELLSVPPLDEQRKIAAVLDKVSDLIAKRRQQLDKLDTLLQSRFIELFGEPLHPLHSQPLGNIAILERGRFSPRPRNDPQYYGGIYPFIQTGDIANCGHRLLNYKQTLNHKGTGVSKKFSAGTIVMAIVGATIGATAILKIDAYAPDSVIGITVDSNRYNNIFMEILLRFWKPELLRIAPESARANINLAILQTIPIPKVELELQDQFAAFVEQTEKTKTSINRGLEKLETVKKALMQEYFG